MTSDNFENPPKIER